MNWKLACIVLLPIPLMLVLTIFFHKRLHTGFDRLFHRWSHADGRRRRRPAGRARDQGLQPGEARGRPLRRTRTPSSTTREVGMITLWTLFGPLMQFCTQIGTLLVWLSAATGSVARRTR